ncbi:spore coat protein YsxE [Bacillus sp. SA1-12]|uniref:spore coat protein YsxE n=1 Tax=Bacillus sp. SA1-12 TaxID=1455638 RepID=UPI000A07DAA9|nr:spore coat protein YsxE [Bacillus sp. SA1-12]
MAIQVHELRPLLMDYDIRAEYIEDISNKAVKVYTDSGTYVLKKLPKQFNPAFVDSFRILSQQGYKGYVPIVKNQQLQYITQKNKEYYYLMPWLANESEDELDARHQYLFKELAKMHSRTEREVKLNGQEAAKHYEALLKSWEKSKLAYEKFVDQCERRLYLSPFELQAVTYFIEVSRAIDFSKKKLKEWSEVMEGKEKGRIVLIHGKISSHHFLYDDQGTGYLTNFERAKYAAPIDDFLIFLNRTASSYPTQCNDCVNWFYTYQKIYPYKEEEMLLFLSYLAFPDRICRIIQSYVNNDEIESELARNQQLVNAYWHFKNIEYIVMNISEMEEKKKMQAESAE